MLIPISVNPKNTLVHISLYILLQARGIAKTKSSKTSCQSTHQNRQMYHQNLQMCRNLRGTLQHVARIRPLFGPHRTLEPLDLRLHGVLGNVREMFTWPGGRKEGAKVGLQLLGPPQRPRWPRPLQSFPGKRVRHGKLVFRGGRVAHEKVGAKRRGGRVPENLAAIFGAGSRNVGQCGLHFAQYHSKQYGKSGSMDFWRGCRSFVLLNDVRFVLAILAIQSL